MSKNLILLHGALGSRDQFEQLKELLKPNFHVYRLNFPGHDGRDFEKDFSIDLFQKAVLHFMEVNALRKTHLFGYSMGGYVALNFALDFPEKVEKIMTLGTKVDWNPETAAKELKMLDPEKIETKVPRFAKSLEARYAPADWKSIVRKTAAMIQKLGAGNALKMENFRKIETPVLVTRGSEDNMVTPKETEYLAQTLQHGKWMEIDGFPHPIEQVEPIKLAEIMGNYFSEDKIWE